MLYVTHRFVDITLCLLKGSKSMSLQNENFYVAII